MDITSTDNLVVYQWREEVLRPIEQGDRISWMILGASISLAHELGMLKTLENLLAK